MKRFLLPIMLLVALVGGWGYYYFLKSNVPSDLKDPYVKIPTGSTMQDLEKILVKGGYVDDVESFKSRAESMGYTVPRPGRFKIKEGWSNFFLIHHLQSGGQEPVKLVLNNERTPEQVAVKIAKALEPDTATLMAVFNDEVLLDSLGFKKETLMCYFLPNTYEFYWNIEPRKILERMQKEFKKFWNDNRLAQAKALNLTPEEVITMASIVDGESNHPEEQAKVAGAYLNRLKQGMRLQADPTVQYALMKIEKTPSFRRLYNKDYLVPHPYNTYVNLGLPPGPVSMPSPSSIDAVLNPEKHNYVYFCAKPDGSNYHNFAETYEQHLVNVKIYQDYLNQTNK